MTVSGDGHTAGFFDLIVIIVHGGVGVCDGAHSSVVRNAAWVHKLANYLIALSGLKSCRGSGRETKSVYARSPGCAHV